jgi:hypothetical protein
MSALAHNGWQRRQDAAVATMPIPDESEDTALRHLMRNFRDTLLVLSLQIVFRATMALRRWNY